MDANVKTEQIIREILWAANSETQPLMRSTGLPPLGSGTPPPFQKPLRQRVMTIQGWCGCVSVAVKPIGDVDGQGCRIAQDLRLGHFGGKEGETVKGSFQPLFSRVLREYD